MYLDNELDGWKLIIAADAFTKRVEAELCKNVNSETTAQFFPTHIVAKFWKQSIIHLRLRRRAYTVHKQSIIAQQCTVIPKSRSLLCLNDVHHFIYKGAVPPNSCKTNLSCEVYDDAHNRNIRNGLEVIMLFGFMSLSINNTQYEYMRACFSGKHTEYLQNNFTWVDKHFCSLYKLMSVAGKTFCCRTAIHILYFEILENIEKPRK